MNKILNLFHEARVMALFNQKILPLYPEFKKIETIKIIPIKKQIWRTTYHVVIKFSTTFLTDDGASARLPIYLTAHSSEPRNNSFKALLFLWQANFSRGDLAIPRPLFFSDYFNGFFYRGVRGQTLYDYICLQDYKTIEAVIVKAAAWFAKLHNTPTIGADNFNPENSRIETVVPGQAKILQKINLAYPKYFAPCRKIYEIISQKEKEYFANGGQQYLIHGDAHPRNIVKMSEHKIAVIDFTDMCLADFARDLGSFLQQLEFMTLKQINNPAYIKKIQKLFLENYQLNSKVKVDNDAKARISNYYNWTALRTATFFMLKDRPEPARSSGLLIKICQNLNIKTNF